MSITALCELRPRPEHASTIIQLATEQLARPATSVAGRRFARLFQHLDDLSWLLYAAEWDSQEAFEAYRALAPMPGSPEQYTRVPAVQMFRRLVLFERVLCPVGTVQAILVSGPAGAQATCRDLALTYHRAGVREHSSLALLQVHEATERPSDLLIVSGWEDDAPRARQDTEANRALVEQLRAAGATVEQFVGRTVVETASS